MSVSNFYQKGNHQPEMHRDILKDEFVYQLDFWKSSELIELGKMIGLKEGASVLDIGSGWGGPLILFAEKFGIVGEGLDLSENNIELARKNANERMMGEKVSFCLCDAEKYETSRQYDFIIMIDSFVHIKNKRKVLNKCNQMLAKNGKILIAVECANEGISKTEIRKRNRLGAVYTEYVEEYLSIFKEQGFYVEYCKEYIGKRSEFAEKALGWMDKNHFPSKDSMQMIYDLDFERKVSEWIFVLKKKS